MRTKLFLLWLLFVASVGVVAQVKKPPTNLELLQSRGLDPRVSNIRSASTGDLPQSLPPDRDIPAAKVPRSYRLKTQQVVVAPNIRMHPNATTTQSEMSITTHPSNPDIVLAGSNAAQNSISVLSQGWYYTTDGGTTWVGGDTLPTHTNLGTYLSDPAVGIDLDNRLFFSALNLGSPANDVFVSRSTNNGAAWTRVFVSNPGTNEDKGHFTADVNAGSLYESYLYAAFTDFGLSPGPIAFSRSTDHGQNFSAPIPISGGIGSYFAQGVNLAVGPGSEVYAAWSGYDNFPTTSTKVGFNLSTNGGATWGIAKSIDTINEIRGSLVKGGNSIRVASFPSMAVDRSAGPRHGWIYIVYPEKNGSAPDIMLIRSTNGGASWSSAVKVNQDNSGKDQWSPWVTVDPVTGGLYVVYYDSRNFPANDSAQVYISNSLDGGDTFEDVLVSDAPFLPAPIPGLAGGYMGDYIGIAAVSGVVWPCWNDNRTGRHQAYTSRMVFLSVGSGATISVSPDTLDFGTMFIGHSDTLALNIRNLGYPDTLFVSDIHADTNVFIPSLSSLSIPGGNSQSIKVVFAPVATGMQSGTLSITSNDTVHPVLLVPMHGNVVYPPVVGASPDSFYFAVNEGDSASADLTIANTGLGDLSFHIDVNQSGASPQSSLKMNYGVKPMTTIDPIGEKSANEATSENLNSSLRNRSIAGIRSTLVASHVYTGTQMQMGISDFGEIMPFQSPLGAEHLQVGSYVSGYTMAYFDGGLDHVHYAVFANNSNTLTAVSYQEIENTASRTIVEVVLRTTDNKIELRRKFYFDKSGQAVAVSAKVKNISGATLTNVVLKEDADWDVDGDYLDDNWNYDSTHNMIYADDSNYVSIAGEFAPDFATSHGWGQYSQRLTTDNRSPATLFDGFEILHYELGSLGDGEEKELQVVYAAGNSLAALQSSVEIGFRQLANWLAAAPDAGSVPPGGNMHVQVKIKTDQLDGGSFHATLQIMSNDPVTPKLSVPVQLRVFGAPNLVLDRDTVNFGNVFVNYPDTVILNVSNNGSDTLHVTGIINTNTHFTIIGPSVFNLPPHGDQPVRLRFLPVGTGIQTGSLSITSNDPGDPTVTAVLLGNGLLPPDISIAPDSLTKNLFTGDTASQVLTVSNVGFSDLKFSLSLQYAPGPAAADAAAAALIPQLAFRQRADLSHFAREISGEELAQTSSRHDASDLAGKASTSAAAADILLLTTASVTGSVAKALDSLGKAFDLIQTSDFTGIDFSPYRTVIVTMDGGYVEEASVQALANAAASGKVLIMVGGTNYPPYYSGVQKYLLSHTGTQGWTISSTPHLHVTDPSHRLAYGLPATYNFNTPGAAYYMLRINDLNAPVPAMNGDGYPVLVNKSIGAGALLYFTNSPYESYWGNPSDFGILRQIISNAINFRTWLSATPRSGTVPAGSSLDVNVTFDANGLNGGDYRANLVLASNDPATPILSAPVHLQVTGAPNITISKDTIFYGDAYVGFPENDSIKITNTGTDVLMVSDLSSDNSRFVPDGVSFSISPLAFRMIHIALTPTDTGIVTGKLTVKSNDPTDSIRFVELGGHGIYPPVIGVTPDSLGFTVNEGDSAVAQISIANHGLGELRWGGTATTSRISSATPYTLPARVVSVSANNVDAGRSVTTLQKETARTTDDMRQLSSVTTNLADLSGKRIGISDPFSIYGVIRSDLVLRGAIVANITFPLGAGVFDSLDVLSVDDGIGGATASDITMMRNWVQSGKAIVVQGDDASSMSNINALLSGSGISETSTGGYSDAVFTNILAHPTTAGVDSINALSYGAYSTVVSPAQTMVFDNLSRPNIVVSTLGTGRVLVSGNEVMGDYNFGVGDTRLFSNQVFDWLSAAAGFVVINPSSGTVVPGDSEGVQVKIRTAQLDGGTFHAYIHIENNDPGHQDFVVPVELRVVGKPDLVLGADSIDFGNVFIGYKDTMKLRITNNGSDTLHVSNMASSEPLFSVVDPVPFIVNPHGFRDVRLQFMPDAPISESGVLSILSDDPEHPTVIVKLAGHGVYPPVIGVTPDSLSFILYSGDSTSSVLNISNTGLGSLNWTTDVTTLSLSAGSATASRERILPKTEPNNTPSLVKAAKHGLNNSTKPAAPESAGETFGDDFESGTILPKWITNANHSQAVTSTTAARGTLYSLTQTRITGGPGHYDGLSANFVPIQPNQVSFWIRVGSGMSNSGQAAGYFVLGDSAVEDNNGAFFFFARGDHKFVLYPADESVTYTENTWYHIQFKNVNWATKSFDYYVNNTLIGAGLAFRATSTQDFSRLHLYDFTPSIQGWWDEISVGGGDWLFVAPTSGSVAPGGSSPVQVKVRTDQLDGGMYRGNIRIDNNDPARSHLTVPVRLELKVASPLIRVSPETLMTNIVYGDSATLSLTVFNDGDGPLRFTAEDHSAEGAIVGEHVAGSLTRGMMHGNIYRVYSASTLEQFKTYVEIPAPTLMQFAVYEASTAAGPYHRLNSVIVSISDTGRGFYSSGILNAPLHPGRYYYLGTASLDYAKFFSKTQSLPVYVSFGQVVLSGLWNYDDSHPDITPVVGSTTLWYQSVVLSGAYVRSIVPNSATIAVGDSRKLLINIKGKLPIGIFSGELVMSSNDQAKPHLHVPMNINVALELGVSSGWNLVAVPISVDDNRKGTLFPTATSAAFGYAGRYVIAESLNYGTGYWLKFPSDQTVAIGERGFSENTIPVHPAWNLIGSPGYIVKRVDVQSVPPGNIVSRFLAYSNARGYFSTDSLLPGRGFWVKAVGSGQLIMNESGAPATNLPPAAAGIAPDEAAVGESFDMLSFRDAAGGVRTLYFSSSSNFRHADWSELPPRSPAGGFDVRFASQRLVEVRDSSAGHQEYPILLADATYPLTVRWTIHGREVGHVLRVIYAGGKSDLFSMKENGSVSLSKTDIIEMKLVTGAGSMSQIPKIYAMYQNYPNPFNPSTQIRFDLPAASQVRLSLYNTLGQEVVRLLDEDDYPAGVQTVVWNGVDGEGKSLPSGMYFYRLNAVAADGHHEPFTQTRKLLLLK